MEETATLELGTTRVGGSNRLRSRMYNKLHSPVLLTSEESELCVQLERVSTDGWLGAVVPPPPLVADQANKVADLVPVVAVLPGRIVDADLRGICKSVSACCGVQEEACRDAGEGEVTRGSRVIGDHEEWGSRAGYSKGSSAYLLTANDDRAALGDVELRGVLDGLVQELGAVARRDALVDDLVPVCSSRTNHLRVTCQREGAAHHARPPSRTWSQTGGRRSGSWGRSSCTERTARVGTIFSTFLGPRKARRRTSHQSDQGFFSSSAPCHASCAQSC